MSAQPPSTSPADHHLSIIDSLSALPFPELETSMDQRFGWSGPGYHLAVLHESRDFWDERSPEILVMAESELAANLSALAAVLSERWGGAETVDLWPYLTLDDVEPTTVAPEPLDYLSTVANSMQVWRLPEIPRWLGLTIGQSDREFPFQLLVAFGNTQTGTETEHIGLRPIGP